MDSRGPSELGEQESVSDGTGFSHWKLISQLKSGRFGPRENDLPSAGPCCLGDGKGAAPSFRTTDKRADQELSWILVVKELREHSHSWRASWRKRPSSGMTKWRSGFSSRDGARSILGRSGGSFPGQDQSGSPLGPTTEPGTWPSVPSHSIHSFHRYLFSTYYVPGIQDTAAVIRQRTPCPHGVCLVWQLGASANPPPSTHIWGDEGCVDGAARTLVRRMHK